MRRFYLKERNKRHERLRTIDLENLKESIPSCQMREDYVISSDTLLLLDLSQIGYKHIDKTLIVERGDVPFLIKTEMTHVLERNYTSTFYSQREKEQVLTRFLGKRYRYPHFSTEGIFMPFNKEDGKVSAWFNLLHVKNLKGVTSSDGLFTGCQIEFLTGLVIQVPKSRRAVKRTMTLDIKYSYLYYYFIYWSVGFRIEDNEIVKGLNKVVKNLELEVPIVYDSALFKQMGFYFSFLKIAHSLIENDNWTVEELESFLKL
ncbi:hypothetical protein OL233_03575 [Vagococcus sp. PNs007]|uniref:Uncharacterized protein n=1 Tax=Vagococcus proximus TaxID=2991417 RepID=A0ABT5X028_9ENTE|nr:hypothetical protein [Vagococcus proximus]MDF0479360.1 hypothetical protein [Vagococcus proximus]